MGLFETTNSKGTPVAKRQGRESARKDVWLTDEDMRRIEVIAEEMQRRGVDPNNQFGKLSVSKVIQWALEQQTLIIGGDS